MFSLKLLAHRRSLALLDAAAWLLATLALVAARYDFGLNQVQWSTVALYAVTLATLHVGAGVALKFYQGRYNIGSYLEAGSLAVLSLGLGAVVGLVFALFVGPFPLGVALTVPLGALVLMWAGRFAARAVVSLVRARHRAAGAKKALIYGAGNAGQQLGRMLTRDPDAPYQVVGYLDDDPAKRHLRLNSGRVVGTGAEVLARATELGASAVLVAIPDATGALLRRLDAELEPAGVELLALPPVKKMLNGQVRLTDLRHLDMADLLGRSQVHTDLTEIAGYLTGKVVLITGAGGSIGSEIARQVHAHDPKRLVLLDRDESGLHAVQLSIYHQGLLDSRDMVLCDIRDHAALDAVFAEHEPDVVFHAAALKHLPMLENYPQEGWKTNVQGTLNVLECAAAHGVGHFVNISTDKAADATSVLGKTKRRAEELTSWFAQQEPGTYLSVRFGNVLGSRGSVLHTFYSQIESGGPVTVVDPEITRYFMTIPEACELVIQAGVIGSDGDVLVLDMGTPVRIDDVARRLIKDSGKRIEIAYTGLRPGEKLHEVLFSDQEEATPTSHPLISRVSVPAHAPEDVGAGPDRQATRSKREASPSHRAMTEATA